MRSTRLLVALAAALAVLPVAAAATRADGTISTVAGTGVAGRTGDGGPAVAAEIYHPRGIAALPGGGFLFAEPYNNTVRRVDAGGTITTVAGTGQAGFSGDGGPATAARLDFVHGVALLPDGGFVLADMLNNRIRRVRPDGTIVTVAGNGQQGYSGDGGPATSAALNLPRGIATRPNGELLIPDSSNHRVRLVRLDGTIVTVAGTGTPGFSGDGGPATAAQLDVPFGVSPLPDGGFLIAERRGQRVRRVAADGTITTVAGTGQSGFSGDGGPAVAARLADPHSVAALPDGGFLIADTDNHRVRRVRPDGTIVTIAGTGVAGFAGDAGAATAAELDEPKAVTVLPSRRGILIGDATNNRVRLLSLDLRAPLVLTLSSRSLRARTGRPLSITVVVSRKARVDVSVRAGTRVLARAAKPGATGRAVVVVRKRLLPGQYVVTVTARSADGRTASARTGLRVTR